jgi:hypothetical protein
MQRCVSPIYRVDPVQIVNLFFKNEENLFFTCIIFNIIILFSKYNTIQSQYMYCTNNYILSNQGDLWRTMAAANLG